MWKLRAALLAGSVAACELVSGVSDLEVVARGPDGGGSSGASGSTAGSGNGGSAGSGGSGGAAGQGGTGGSSGTAGSGGTPSCTLPIAPAGTLRFHATMDDAAALATPAVGSGVGAVVSGFDEKDFGPGVCDQAVHVSSGSRILAYPERVAGVDNISYATGTLMFWFKPEFALSDGTSNPLLRTTQVTLRGGIDLKKTPATSQGSLVFALWPFEGGAGDAGTSKQESRSTSLGAATPTLSKGQWTHVAVSWDATNASSVVMRVFFDGAEQSTVQESAFLGSVAPTSDAQHFYIGTVPNTSSSGFAQGWFDDLRIYSQPLP